MCLCMLMYSRRLFVHACVHACIPVNLTSYFYAVPALLAVETGHHGTKENKVLQQPRFLHLSPTLMSGKDVALPRSLQLQLYSCRSVRADR